MLIGNMNNKHFDEFSSRDGLNNQFAVFVAVVMKGNAVSVIIVNS